MNNIHKKYKIFKIHFKFIKTYKQIQHNKLCKYMKFNNKKKFYKFYKHNNNTSSNNLSTTIYKTLTIHNFI